jgi:tetraacyldisaccharide 4'-kinase
VSAALVRAWYRGHPALLLLAPFSLLYAVVIFLRRLLYRSGVFAAARADVPVIVIGNITVGGTGKTPLTLALIERLRAAGYRPGVVSRGYGGRAPHYPLRVEADSSSAEAGDEPVMLVRRSGVPLMVDPRRGRAAAELLARTDCDVVLCDDGLQHYALARDIEIAVVDAARGLGNGWLLPAGPLREPRARLQTVDFLVANGEGGEWPQAFRMRLQSAAWRSCSTTDIAPPAPGSRIHAVAGIGNPDRFFAQLRAEGFSVIEHAFPDHHAYSTADLNFGDNLPLVMTEKDMVKCRGIVPDNAWYVPVDAELPEPFYEALLNRLQALKKVKTNAG